MDVVTQHDRLALPHLDRALASTQAAGVPAVMVMDAPWRPSARRQARAGEDGEIAAMQRQDSAASMASAHRHRRHKPWLTPSGMTMNVGIVLPIVLRGPSPPRPPASWAQQDCHHDDVSGQFLQAAGRDCPHGQHVSANYLHGPRGRHGPSAAQKLPPRQAARRGAAAARAPGRLFRSGGEAQSGRRCRRTPCRRRTPSSSCPSSAVCVRIGGQGGFSASTPGPTTRPPMRTV